MLSDARIVHYVLRSAVQATAMAAGNAFRTPQGRRTLAATLRKLRSTAGSAAARLQLAIWSADALNYWADACNRRNTTTD